tara:strand:- start:270 stop:701 length:432 start_codon:yes stop_codon:yes gene_type:complete
MLTIVAISYFLLFVLFFQSSIDKIINWKDNYTWLQDYFAKTFLNRFTKFNLLVITVLELISALMCLFCTLSMSIYYLWLDDSYSFWVANFEIQTLTNILCSITLLFLFTGQRIAKDYLGAVRIIPYFVLILVLTCLIYYLYGA